MPEPSPAALVKNGRPLSLALREATRDVHKRAERTGVIRELLAGTAGHGAYLLLLRNLEPVYAAMERRLEAAGDGPLRELARPGLYRAAALERDLRHLAGARWRHEIPLLEAGAAYQQRVEEVSAAGLAAHAYVRYLGDLNGGRILSRVLGETLGLTTRELGFYHFPAIPDVPRCIADYRAALDRLAPALDTAEMVAEARYAFECNIALSQSVEEAANPGP
ncbi:MAG: biliverdin-producing heme oxygenase [Gammaproteobacteria bacterium]|nr:biliverdin-producing heme oxygenase [Gammaproteobacteria bacterium]